MLFSKIFYPYSAFMSYRICMVLLLKIMLFFPVTEIHFKKKHRQSPPRKKNENSEPRRKCINYINFTNKNILVPLLLKIIFKHFSIYVYYVFLYFVFFLFYFIFVFESENIVSVWIVFLYIIVLLIIFCVWTFFLFYNK